MKGAASWKVSVWESGKAVENGRHLLFLVNNNVLHMLLEWINTEGEHGFTIKEMASRVYIRTLSFTNTRNITHIGKYIFKVNLNGRLKMKIWKEGHINANWGNATVEQELWTCKTECTHD